MSIEFASSIGYIFFCIVAGLLSAALLYYSKKNKKQFNGSVRTILATIRFITVFLLSLLLLSPLIKNKTRYTEKPIVIVASDNSESVRFSRDSIFNTVIFPAELNAQLNNLKEDFDFLKMSFGSKVNQNDSLTYQEKSTNIQMLLDEVSKTFGKRKVGALVLVSDGLYNKGNNPVYTAQNFSSPIITIGLGDTTSINDAAILKTTHNSLGFLGNKIPIEIDVKAFGFEGKQTALKILRNGRTLATQNIFFDRLDFFGTIQLQVPAEEVGMLKFSITLSPLSGEYTTTNNYEDIYVEVIDSKRKIAIVGDAPHPDLGAIKQAIESNKNYETQIWYNESDIKDLKDLNVAILHNVPGKSRKFAELISKLQELKIPTWYILGQNFSISEFNKLNTGLNISNYRNSFDAAYPSINNNFTAFTSDEAIDQLMKIGIPYLSPFGNYQTDSRVETYLYKKIGNVVTNAPLLLFVNEGSYKNAVLAGEGLWRHRIESYKITSSHTAFDSWIGKIIQYLSIAEDKNRFKLKYPKLTSEDEDMIIIGEFYNQSFELTNEPEALLSLKNDSGQVFKYTFNRVKDYYLANVGKLSPGEYIITAELENAGEKFNRTGKFSVKSSNLESGNIVANFNLLRQISSTSNGEFITAKELNELPQILENLETTQTIIFNKIEYGDLINFKLLFYLFLLLFALEWGIRKYSGTI